MPRCHLPLVAIALGALSWACEEGPPPAEPIPSQMADPAAEPPTPHTPPIADDDPPAPDDPAPPSDEPEPPPVDRNDSPAFVAQPPVMARLTADQHRATLVDLFGEGLPATPVEPDTNPHLYYGIGAATTEVSAGGVEQYADVAFSIAAAVFAEPGRRARILSCAPQAADDDCVRRFIREAGRRILRRPLDPDEQDRWLTVAAATAEGDPLRGVETVLAGWLQSPSFLYRVERGEPSPTADDPGRLRYTDYEMATRLAYLLTNSTPDAELLDAAERGELVEASGLEAQTRRLLGLPRAREAVQDFFAQYLDLPRLARVQRDPAAYPGFDAHLLWAMETEVRLLVDDLVFRRGADIRELLSAPRGYVNRGLATLYGIEAPGATGAVFVPVDFGPETPRAGVLGLAAFLTMNAHPTETSPTLRGKYVRERVLCQTVPPPPDDIDLNLAPGEDDPPTLRERLEQHREDPACRSCHRFIDPPGFLFEHFDSIGRHREAVDGFPVDASGDLDGAALDDSVDLATLLRDDPRVARCIARQLYRYANNRLDTIDERAVIDELQSAMETDDYAFDRLVVALVQSRGFRTLAPPDESEAPPADATPEGGER